MTRALLMTSSVLWLSGCCCALPASADTSEWEQAVAREARNRQIYALEPGTLNVFELEVSYPTGWTQADEDAAVERAARREVRRLQELLVSRGVDVGALEDVPAVVRRGWRPSYRLRFSLVHPRPALPEEPLDGADCGPCREASARRRAVPISNFGWAPIDLQTVTREQLIAGVDVARSSVRSPGDQEGVSFAPPPEGSARLRLVESCPVKLARMSGAMPAGNGSGVIAVPRTEERTWYELRDARCGDGAVTTRENVGPQFQPGPLAESRQRVWQLQAQLQRLGVAY